MEVSLQDLTELQEQIQEDLSCVLDGEDNTVVDRVCQVVVDRMRAFKQEKINQE